ncbi:MAG: T9SS type A sorting domain-containing protein [Bacteroidota bacterium]
MKARIFGLLSLGLFFSLAYFYFEKAPSQPNQPMPTDGTIVVVNEEEGDNQSKREAWFELMHRTAPDVNWRKIEYQNQITRHQARKNEATESSGGNEVLADGNLEGEWRERGSINQSGSVFETLYDEDSDQIYTISAGGTLWKGERDGSNWEVINQDLKFNPGLLQFVQMESHKRMIALIGQFPHYSDDGGLNWIPSEGIQAFDGWARSKWIHQLPDENQSIFLISRPDAWSAFKVYKSTDQGETFTSIISLVSSDQDRYALCKPHHSNELYLIEKINNNFTGFYRIDPVTNEIDTLEVTNQFSFQGGRANLYASKISDELTRFYAYDGNGNVYISEDSGTTWILQGTTPERPWEVGIYVSPSNPDFLLTGGIECHKSYDAGKTWETMNGWGEYYDDVVTKLHADMMVFHEVQTVDGDTVTLVSNHGGLSISYDQMAHVENISLAGLNVSQYYDVRTDPTWPYLFYGGSQDQGFQRGWSMDEYEVVEMEQVISGDYGHIAFSGNGEHLWTVYPGGWITYYYHPIDGGYNASWEVDSDDESVWIPPLMESPNPEEDIVYLAGGAANGGSGSYMIQLEYTLNGNIIIPTQMPFNFMSNSGGGQLSAMKTAPLNADRWYAATTNGRFFYSTDAGANWEQSLNFVPDGHYLYGQSILPSKKDEMTVYYGGSGYSNPGVFVSYDGGINFTEMSEGLPSTMVFELAADKEENLLFAATEAGPYVYVFAEQKWYDMRGDYAPTQTYWSVEYVEAFDIVRFGTYGRGVWDFQITNSVSTASVAPEQNRMTIFPNPSDGEVNIRTSSPLATEANIQVFDLQGKWLMDRKVQTGNGSELKLDFSNLATGNYIIQLKSGDQTLVSKLLMH